MSRRRRDRYDDDGDNRRSSRREGSFRRARAEEERRFELLIFIALVILMIVMSLSPSTNGRIMALISGGLLVMSGVIQMQRRFAVNIFTWLGAAALLLMGYFINPLPPLYPILALGAVLFMSFLRGDL
jgi:uncharacterized membrane protein HdeD (DUF308 family)